MRLALFFLLLPFACFAQSVGIGTNTPDNSALLHLESTDKGLLVPKVALVSTISSSPVSSPAEGLLVYNTSSNTEVSPGFYMWNGIEWERITTASKGAVPRNGIIEAEQKQVFPGYSYIGYQYHDNFYYTKIGTGFGSWITLPAYPFLAEVYEPSHTFYNDKFFVWSGEDNSYASYENTGAYYNVNTNNWTAMSTVNAPTGRHGNTMATDPVSGYMFIWGGVTSKINAGITPVLTATGAIYDVFAPTNPWITMAASPLAARYRHTAICSNPRMIVWGGSDANGVAFGDGAAYIRTTNTWQLLPASPLAARYGHTAVWTGSRMIIFGGTNGTVNYNDGAAYDPVSNTWTSIANAPASAAVHHHSAIWTGTEMIIYGGNASAASTSTRNTCFRYNPVSNTWVTGASSPTPTIPSTSSFHHRAVWTGTEMVVAGGSNSVNTGGMTLIRAYDPASNTWRFYNNIPSVIRTPALVWTGSQVLVQSGTWYDNRGYRFDPNSGTIRDIEVSEVKLMYKYRKD